MQLYEFYHILVFIGSNFSFQMRVKFHLQAVDISLIIEDGCQHHLNVSIRVNEPFSMQHLPVHNILYNYFE